MADATTTTTKSGVWPLIHEQRRKVGDMMATLTPEQWDAGSLCAGWRVRDVAAHCVETQLMTPARFFGRYLGSGFRFDQFNAGGVDRHRSESTDALLAEYRSSAPGTNAPPGPVLTWLAEALIHGEDMARPAGKRIDTSPEVLIEVANYARRTKPLLHGKDRSLGLKLRATDVDWTAGEGPEVSGPAASLILAITGRRPALDDLSGDGLETLRSRIS